MNNYLGSQYAGAYFGLIFRQEKTNLNPMQISF